ncbi:MAG: pyridoxamine 5'-phosphate oxidase, partial [Gammaproteobacteria bacterium]|nr:pyridoxamine 5'-phosphate oxidase [Gammaproteobacteria bacterium]
FADSEDIPRPPHWGGYRLWISALELWIDGDSRLHDRARWIRTLAIDDDGQAHPDSWSVARLQP